MQGSEVRRGRRVVLATVLVAVVAVAAVVIWQVLDRRQQEARLAELEQSVLSVSIPELPPYRMSTVNLLPSDRGPGLEIGYTREGDRVPQLKVLQLQYGSDQPDLCGLLQRAEPLFAEADCSADGADLTASLSGPDDLLVAEGRVYAGTLAVVVAHPSDLTADELRARIGATRTMTVRELVERIDG